MELVKLQYNMPKFGFRHSQKSKAKMYRIIKRLNKKMYGSNK